MLPVFFWFQPLLRNVQPARRRSQSMLSQPKGEIAVFLHRFGNWAEGDRRAYPPEDRITSPDRLQTTVEVFFDELTSRPDPLQYSYM